MDYSKLNDNQLFEIILTRDLCGLERLIAEKVNVNQIWEIKSTTPLVEAIKLDWLDGIKLIIKAGADVNLYSKLEESPLNLAALKGNFEIVKLLLQWRAHPNGGGFSLLNAVETGSVEVVLALISAGAQVNEFSGFYPTPLMRAAYLGRLQIVEILCSAGACVNFVDYDSGKTALVMAASMGHKDVFDYLFPLTSCFEQREWAKEILPNGIILKQRRENKLLCDFIKAAFEGNINVVTNAIASGVEVNAFGVDGESALHAAAHRGNEALIKILLKAGAEIEKLTENNEYTPLMIAAFEGNKEAVNTLIKAGANYNIIIDNMSTLMIATEGNRKEVVKILIEAGANINAKNNDGWTALMFAARNKNEEVVKVLVNAGADINAKNNDGWTALMFTANSRNLEAYNFLIGAGADIKAKNNDGFSALFYLEKALSEIPF